MASELEQKISAIDDITDSEAFDEVLIYLDQIQLEDEEFMETLVSRRRDMIISWEQPWYQQSNCLTKKVINLEHNIKDEEFDKGKESYRTDNMSSDEILQIEKNWKHFIKLFNLPDTPICLARWKNTSKCRNPQTAEECVRRFVTAFLAQGLQRNLHQVYKHFVIHYGYHARGFYTPNEEKIISICLYHMPKNPVPTISLVLGRDPRGIYKRLKQKDKEPTKFNKRRWTMPLATKLVKLLMEHTGLSLRKLKNKKVDMPVWLKIQEEMEYSYINLQFYWYHILHAQLYVKRNVKRNRLRKKLFKRIRKMSYKIWSDIRWKEVAKHFRDGFTHIFLYRMCYRVVSRKKDFIRTPLEELIPFALDVIKKMPNKRLKTIILNENQELEECEYSKTDIEVKV